MTTRPLPLVATLLVGAAVLVGGCGSSSPKSKPAGGSSKAQSAAGGDIPDNQVFLTFHDSSVGYSLSYPEGWSRSGGGRRLTFSDKGNSVHLQVATSRPSSPATTRSKPERVTLKHGPALKTTYTRIGPADPVTAKRPQLMVDRYVYVHGREVATLDLSTPKGVDNVDAYRLIANSFQWR